MYSSAAEVVKAHQTTQYTDSVIDCIIAASSVQINEVTSILLLLSYQYSDIIRQILNGNKHHRHRGKCIKLDLTCEIIDTGSNI